MALGLLDKGEGRGGVESEREDEERGKREGAVCLGEVVKGREGREVVWCGRYLCLCYQLLDGVGLEVLLDAVQHPPTCTNRRRIR